MSSPTATKVLLDIDGVLTVSWRPLPGAVDTVRWLRDHGVDFRLVTNTSSLSRVQIAARLSRAGIHADPDQIQTAVSSAADYLADTYPGAACHFLNQGDVGTDLGGARLVGPADAEVVLLGGAGPAVGYRELDAVFKRAIEGVPVVALHRNTRFQTEEGPSLDMGAFIAGLEAAASIEVPVVGKPAAAFFGAALRSLGAEPSATVMVGDDLTADVLGAQAVGIGGVLVQTGKFRPADLEGSAGAPDLVIADIGRLPGLLEPRSPAE